jgi:hypothetical protein
MLTKEKRRAVLSAALFLVVGIMIITSSAFASTSINAFASTSSDLFIVSSDSGAEVHTMKLKAVKENGEVRPVSGFAISIENVVSVERNGKVTVFSAPTSPTFTSAKITDINDNTVDIPITDTGVISFAGYREGVYTLDVIVDDRFAFECIVVIGPEEGQQQIINKQITEVNQQTDVNIITKKFAKGINKEEVCLFTPSHPICKPKNGKCPSGWGMNEDGQCFPMNKKCPKGYWRADDDESGACVPIQAFCIDIFPPPPGCPGYNPALIRGTPEGNLTDGTGNATDTTPPDIPPINDTQSDGSGGVGANETIIPEPPPECPEGEQLAPDGLSCEPIVTEEPLECPEGEQPTADGLGCEPIMAEEPIPVECGEGEELVDGQCQVIPTEEIPTEEDEEDTAPEEEDQVEPEDDGGDGDGDEEGGAEQGGAEQGGDEQGVDEGGSQ